MTFTLPHRLSHIIYVSRATRHMSPDDLLGLLMECREHNEEKQITGMLIYNNQYFFQVIEGPKLYLENIYQSILADPRHGQIQEIQHKSINARSFPDWSMRVKNMTHISFDDEGEFNKWVNHEFDDNVFKELDDLAHNLILSYLKSSSIKHYPNFNPLFS